LLWVWIVVAVVSFIVITIISIVCICRFCCAVAQVTSTVLLVDQPNPNVQMSGMGVYDNKNLYGGGNFSVNASVNAGYSG